MTQHTIKQHHVMYVLDCGHVVLSAPSLVTSKLSVWCNVDFGEHRVTGVHIYEWRAKCSCNFARWTGTSEMLAQQIANGHAQRMPTHKPRAEYAVNPAATDELVRLRKMKVI